MATDHTALIAEARRLHVQDQVIVNGPLEDWCAKCGESWPCSVTSLADALEEAGKDSARLNWLDANCIAPIQHGMSGTVSVLAFWAHNDRDDVTTMRAAIDAAMKGGSDAE